MSQLKVRQALEKRLSTFATSKSLPVVWENVAAIPTTSFIKATIFPGETVDPSMGANHRRYVGIFRVTFYSTDLNKGMAAIEGVVDDLVAYFPRGIELTKDGYRVNIDRTPYTRSPGIESNYIFISVEMYYRCDVIS